MIAWQQILTTIRSGQWLCLLTSLEPFGRQKISEDFKSSKFVVPNWFAPAFETVQNPSAHFLLFLYEALQGSACCVSLSLVFFIKVCSSSTLKKFFTCMSSDCTTSSTVILVGDWDMRSHEWFDERRVVWVQPICAQTCYCMFKRANQTLFWCLLNGVKPIKRDTTIVYLIVPHLLCWTC